MGTPQIVLITLWAVGLGVNMAKHGKPQGLVNVWDNIIVAAIIATVLWWGGFWS